jgi:chromosome segregation ATPase
MVDETTTEQLAEIEGQGDTVQNGLVRDVTHLLEESGVLDSAKAEQQIEELRSEVSYVQRLLCESRQRVTQLEELVGSLRTINEAQEKAFNAAGKANTDLQHRLNVVAAEWAEQAETIRRLQIELDAAQQVPQAIADRFEEGWNQGTARAVETVLEWLEPIRAVDHLNLANETLQHLPQIMRHLTGLAQD